MRISNKMFWAKKILIFLLASLFIISYHSVFAESIFLKDGKIIEGAITKETDKATEIKTSDGQKLSIARKDILRTLVNTSYKTKMYIMKDDKSVIAVYIVDEDNESYTYRTELKDPNESKIKKDNVLFISKIPPQEFIQEKDSSVKSNKKAHTREEEIKFRAPLLRAGLTKIIHFDDNELTELYDQKSTAIIFDAFLYRLRGPLYSGEGGIDLMFRFRNHGAKVDSSEADPRTQKFNELYNTTIISSYSADFFLTTVSLGPRVAWGFYKFVHIQPYAFLLYSTGKFKTMISHDNRDDEYDNTVHGIDYGLGVDIGIFPYFGIFAEYTGGWIKSQFPGGQEYNFDANAIYFGASFRTSYGLLE
jgi:hypothetical protein